VIYTSDYAANKAVEYYGLDPQKLRVATFGADIDIQPNPEEIAKMIQSRSRDRCRLLFLGTDWGRKGGQAALDIAQELHRRGLEIEFVVVASHVKDLPEPLPDFMQLTGYIKKHEEPGTSQWRQLLSRAHFLLLPTRADLTPLIISEAAAYGLPCLASHVGGISTIIKEDVNGHTFPLDNSVNTYCDYIADVFADRKRYEELALSSYQEYETRLNWSAVGRTVFGYLEEVLNG